MSHYKIIKTKYSRITDGDIIADNGKYVKPSFKELLSIKGYLLSLNKYYKLSRTLDREAKNQFYQDDQYTRLIANILFNDLANSYVRGDDENVTKDLKALAYEKKRLKEMSEFIKKMHTYEANVTTDDVIKGLITVISPYDITEEMLEPFPMKEELKETVQSIKTR